MTISRLQYPDDNSQWKCQVYPDKSGKELPTTDVIVMVRPHQPNITFDVSFEISLFFSHETSVRFIVVEFSNRISPIRLSLIK